MKTTRLACCIALLAAAGCAPTTPHWDSNFGASVREARAQQTRSPAPASALPPEGVDGPVAQLMLQRYYKSVAQPAGQGGQPASAPQTAGQR
ncbi:MAG TPA: hypothetical protein VIT92_03955 [Burkholderiaceae bacterium]